MTAVSNGANITDGLDGLAAGVSAIIGAAIGVFVYVSGNYKFADYLNIMYIPNLAELSVFIGAFVGACIGFVVQCLPGAGVHGRYRQSRARWHYCFTCHYCA